MLWTCHRIMGCIVLTIIILIFIATILHLRMKRFDATFKFIQSNSFTFCPFTLGTPGCPTSLSLPDVPDRPGHPSWHARWCVPVEFSFRSLYSRKTIIIRSTRLSWLSSISFFSRSSRWVWYIEGYSL